MFRRNTPVNVGIEDAPLQHMSFERNGFNKEFLQQDERKDMGKMCGSM